jgi:hypothetical protein
LTLNKDTATQNIIALKIFEYISIKAKKRLSALFNFLPIIFNDAANETPVVFITVVVCF